MSDSESRDGANISVNSSKDSCSASSTRRSGCSSSSESAAEEEEQEDPSSSSLAQSPVKVHEAVEDELSNFRQLWKKDISKSCHKNDFHDSSVLVDEENNEEEINLKAKNWFLEGVENEKNGRLHEAIRFYKKAVQLVPDIEFKLCSSQSNKQKQGIQNECFEETVDDECQLPECNHNSEEEEEDDEDRDLELMLKLQKFISRSKSICRPASDQRMTHISSLPMEIILYILRWVVSQDLDMRSLEMCSMVCRGFYICSRDPEIWRLACLKVWGMNCGGLKNYDSWRMMFLTRPRLNFNGFYISRTTYIRHGENSFQDQFYRPWHFVEYYRYFRFFPEGIVFMLTTPDQPARVTYILKGRENWHPSILKGHYRLQDDRVFIVLHRAVIDVHKKWKTNVPQDLIEQTYHIELQVASRKQRINQCLTWKRYCVTGVRGNSETTNFEVMSNKFPSFWFSRVKSYTTKSEKPL